MGLFSGLMGHGSEIDGSEVERLTEGLLVEGERVTHAFRVVRDSFVFTDRRLIIIDIQGMTGSKVDYRTIPYRAIVGFSVETAGTFDFDAELKIWVSGSPAPIEKTLKRGTDMRAIQRCLAAGACR
ncbi:MAG: PH domain-containing protein [Pseudomonadota bacterium]|nr:PH domain-containing protein [Pseudomonadota bacterium]